MEEKIYLRRVKETDMKLLFDWRNNELVRKNSFCMDPVEWNEHVKWFNTTLVKSSVLFFILICKIWHIIFSLQSFKKIITVTGGNFKPQEYL